MENRDWCEYIYHTKGEEFSDGYGNKIFILGNACVSESEDYLINMRGWGNVEYPKVLKTFVVRHTGSNPVLRTIKV